MGGLLCGLCGWLQLGVVGVVSDRVHVGSSDVGLFECLLGLVGVFGELNGFGGEVLGDLFESLGNELCGICDGLLTGVSDVLTSDGRVGCGGQHPGIGVLSIGQFAGTADQPGVGFGGGFVPGGLFQSECGCVGESGGGACQACGVASASGEQQSGGGGGLSGELCCIAGGIGFGAELGGDFQGQGGGLSSQFLLPSQWRGSGGGCGYGWGGGFGCTGRRQIGFGFELSLEFTLRHGEFFGLDCELSESGQLGVACGFEHFGPFFEQSIELLFESVVSFDESSFSSLEFISPLVEFHWRFAGIGVVGE